MPEFQEQTLKFIQKFTGVNLNKREKPKAEWRNTTVAEKEAKKKGFFEEKGFFFREKSYQGRPIISRDKPINGGVSIGASREAIVVDDEKDEKLNDIYRTLLRRIKDKENLGHNLKKIFLDEAWDLVLEVIPYDEENVNKVTFGHEIGSKHYLSNFFGGGVCRHQALLVGYLIERLAKEGYAGGRVSVDRNYVPDKGGHAWARYTSSQNEVFILDPAQNYIGKLDNMSENQDRWFYERPEDVNLGSKLVATVRRKFSHLGRQR